MLKHKLLPRRTLLRRIAAESASIANQLGPLTEELRHLRAVLDEHIESTREHHAMILPTNKNDEG